MARAFQGGTQSPWPSLWLSRCGPRGTSSGPAIVSIALRRLNASHVEKDDDVEHDLESQPSSTTMSTPTSSSAGSSVSTVTHSTLVYEADGKRLMRLPRDQVRLLMDPDLDAGILAVVVPDDDDTTAPSAKNDPAAPLSYLLTVEDDLYRKIVAEMEPRQPSTCCVCGHSVEFQPLLASTYAARGFFVPRALKPIRIDQSCHFKVRPVMVKLTPSGCSMLIGLRSFRGSPLKNSRS